MLSAACFLQCDASVIELAYLLTHWIIPENDAGIQMFSQSCGWAVILHDFVWCSMILSISQGALLPKLDWCKARLYNFAPSAESYITFLYPTKPNHMIQLWGIYALLPLGHDVWVCGHHPTIQVFSQRDMAQTSAEDGHKPYVSNLIGVDRVEQLWHGKVSEKRAFQTAQCRANSMDDLRWMNIGSLEFWLSATLKCLALSIKWFCRL